EGAVRIGEVDRAVGLDHDVVRPVEALALKIVGDHGEAAIKLTPRHPPRLVLAGDDAALLVAGEPVRLIGVLLEHGHALARRVLHPLDGMDVAEQEIAALLDPDRSLGRAERSAEAESDVLDRLGRGDDLFQRRIELLDAFCSRRLCSRSGPYRDGKAARRGHAQHVPPTNVVWDSHDLPPLCLSRFASVDGYFYARRSTRKIRPTVALIPRAPPRPENSVAHSLDKLVGA